MTKTLNDRLALDEFIPLGRVKRPHGLSGAVVVALYNPANPNGLLTAPLVYLLNPPNEPKKVTLTGQVALNGLIVKVKGTNDRTAAESLKNLEFAVKRRDLPPLDPEEYYLTDLIGLTVTLTDGRPLGEVKGFLEPGGAPVLVIQNASGQEFLTPFCEDLVPLVDLEAGLLTVAERPGLFDLTPPKKVHDF
ncbi:MAG: ribosome maturation factor RimM [Deltaproteobacteria bacterium]|nr:ribosome maturation factor RimM [Deltaproteobacteria bacterium]